MYNAHLLFLNKFYLLFKKTYKESDVNELKRNIADLSKIKKLGFTPRESLEDFINQIN